MVVLSNLGCLHNMLDNPAAAIDYFQARRGRAGWAEGGPPPAPRARAHREGSGRGGAP